MQKNEEVKVTEVKATEKPAAKKTTAKKETAKKTATKATKSSTSTEIIVQYQNNEVEIEIIKERVKTQFVSEGHRASSIKQMNIYVKPEEYSAYYVVNGKFSGRVDLF